MKRALSALLRWLRQNGASARANAPLVLLSLGLATVLWAFVTNLENPSVASARSFPVSLLDPVNVPKSMIVTQEVPDTVNVTLLGPRQAVDQVKLEDFQLQVDLAGASASNGLGGAVTYDAPVRVQVRKRGVRAEVDPSTLRVTIQPEAHRTVPIKVSLIDAPPIGFELDSPPTSDPDQATVTGLQQNVDAVDAVYADLKLGTLSVSTTVTLPLVPRSSDGRTIGGVTVQPNTAPVKVSIKRTVFNRDAFVAVQTHGRPALGYQVVDASSDPPTVTIAGSLDMLNSVTTIPTDAVEIEGATQDVKRVVNLEPPPGVSIVNPRTVTATVSITPARGPGSVLVAPRVVGLGAGLTAQLSVSSLTVSFTGPMPVVLAVKPGDITATLDLSGLGPGSVSLEPRISLPASLDKDSVTPPKVDITITGPPAAATPAR